MHKHLPDVMRFVELFGFRFELDWDDSLIITPRNDDPFACFARNDTVLFVLKQCSDEISRRLRNRRANALHQFVGGPFNGKAHDFHYCSRPVVGRAFYVGEATSEKKARELAWSTVPGKVDP